MTEEQRQLLIDRFKRITPESIAYLLLGAMDTGEIPEATVVRFAQRVWAAYKQERQTQIDVTIAELQKERAVLG